MRVVLTIEARMGSTRLPGKMMEPLWDGKPALECMIRRLEQCEYPHDIVVATSTESGDDVIAETASTLGVSCFRGSEEDVLGRIVGCAREFDADVVCETTGDCPLIDPQVVDQAIACFLENPRSEYVTNVLSRSWPHGMDVEVVSRAALEEVAATTDNDSHREHVTTYIRDNPADFDAFHVSPPPKYRDPSIRVTLDYQADLELIREVYARLAEEGDPFLAGVGEVVTLFHEDPALAEINAAHVEFSSDSRPGIDAT